MYGVDDRFWTFQGAAPEAYPLERSDVFVSEGLARELEAAVDDTLLLRVEMPSSIPISSLHGRREDVGRTLRLGIDRVLTAEEHGEFSFRPQQGLARSVFVSLTRLQQEIEQDGKVNTVLLGVPGGGSSDADPDTRLAAAEAAVREVASLEDVGLRVRTIPEQDQFSVEAAAGLLNDVTVRAIESTADDLGVGSRPVLTYLVNELRRGERVTPYSLVAAIDLDLVSETAAAAASSASGVVLNQWAADDLEATVGDTIELRYYVWEDEGRLVSREAEVQVADIVPIAGAANDRTLAPDYPGITQANDLVSWDPPFEIDLGLIRPHDEDYWDEYRTTPKAFIPLQQGQDSVAIAVGFGHVRPVECRWRPRARRRPLWHRTPVGHRPARGRPGRLSGAGDGSGVIVRRNGLRAVFLLLQLLPRGLRPSPGKSLLPARVEQRLAEIGLLRATGFSHAALWKIFSAEAAMLSVVGSAIGIVAAVGYAEFIMWGLRTWWVDAVGTTRLSLSVSPVALLGGALPVGCWPPSGPSPGPCAHSCRPHPAVCWSGVLAEDTPVEQAEGRSRATLAAAVFLALGLVMVVVSGSGPDGSHGRDFSAKMGWAPAAVRDPVVLVGLAHGRRAAGHDGGLVSLAGWISQRDLATRAQRAVHRADRVGGVHHRGGRVVPP